MDYLLQAFMVGMGATAVMDLWGIARKPLLGIAPPDYGMVGRWLAHMAKGRFRHESIAAASPIVGEKLIGWVAHYLTGITFAGALIAFGGEEWLQHPTIVPALAVGLGSVVAPFLLMQPGMGAGIAASRTPRPGAARIQSLITHAVFGLGLYAAGWATRIFHFS
ncbi:DUF2938 domain-containing protein [Oxalobacteraceae bacterium R-40]|uniref:DUF2938 domain-containing protein n=1 Tax=Keguizhuia sedimenti TaxID=3064264 RepID=A0ABU1BKU5_9BURK|nr:DUF2938 domain-containing protein [Oxalobacteraceae bacterium R-40]